MRRTDTYTAADLNLTGWVLHAHTIDGDDWIITEVLDYHVDWINRAERTKRWMLRGEYHSPGFIGPATHVGPIERFVAVWHGESA